MHLPDSFFPGDAARPIGHGAPAAPKPACRRTALSSAVSTAPSRSPSRCSMSGCGCWRRCRAACCGSSALPPTRAQIWNGRPACAASIRRAWSMPKTRRWSVHLARHASGGPVPGHPALQCPCHVRRCAGRRPAAADRVGRGLCRAGGRQPAACGGTGRTGDGRPGRIRSPRPGTGARSGTIEGAEGQAGAKPAHRAAVRYGPLRPQPGSRLYHHVGQARRGAESFSV